MKTNMISSVSDPFLSLTVPYDDDDEVQCTIFLSASRLLIADGTTFLPSAVKGLV